MGNRTKLVVVVGLLAIVIVAVGLSLKRSLHIGEATPPDSILKQPVEKIDEKSFKLITKTLGEWERLGEREGKFKNPETGDYTMMSVMVCGHCGQKIPYPVIPAETAQLSHHNARIAILGKYKCPKCGALAAEHEPTPER